MKASYDIVQNTLQRLLWCNSMEVHSATLKWFSFNGQHAQILYMQATNMHTCMHACLPADSINIIMCVCVCVLCALCMLYARVYFYEHNPYGRRCVQMRARGVTFHWFWILSSTLICMHINSFSPFYSCLVIIKNKRYNRLFITVLPSAEMKRS